MYICNQKSNMLYHGSERSKSMIDVNYMEYIYLIVGTFQKILYRNMGDAAHMPGM